MHYGIVTYGSRGDVQPYIALSVGLMERGHEVTLFANENFAGLVSSYGINFYFLAGNIEEMVRSKDLLPFLRSGNLVAYAREFKKIMRTLQPEINAQMLQGCKDVDAIIATPLTFTGIYSIAEKLQKKWAIVHLSLPTTPTKKFPFAALSFFNFPTYNLFTYSLIRYIYWHLNKKDINAHRRTLELLPLKTNIIKIIADQKILNVYAFSSALISRPFDYPEHVDITGFLSVPSNKRKLVGMEDVPAGLIDWLKEGEPPIYIGFGSIPIPDTKLFSRIIAEMIVGTNHRFIFSQGWSELPTLPRHQQLFMVKYVNHEWLFPQCKCAVIHGGIGTIAATLKAKIPPIIVSIFADQPLWGKLIDKRKLGIHIPFKKLTTQKILAAIEKADLHELKKNVRNTGEMINGQDGIRSAIDALEKYFAN